MRIRTMKPARQLLALGGVVFLTVLGPGPLPAQNQNSAPPLPSGDQVMERMLVRSEAQAATTNKPAWAYDKLQVMSTLDANSNVVEQTKKLYRVRIVQGVPITQLVKVEGQDLSPAELEKQEHHEAAFEKGLSGRDPKKAVAGHESLVTQDLVARFKFETLRRETNYGHPTLAVSFAGQPVKGDNSLPSRLLSSMQGTVWMDEKTADVAKVDLRLTKGFSLGVLGVLGAVKELRMNIEFKPMTDGTWLPEKTTLMMSARILFSSLRFKMEETSTNFALEPASQTNLP